MCLAQGHNTVTAVLGGFDGFNGDSMFKCSIGPVGWSCMDVLLDLSGFVCFSGLNSCDASKK